MSPRGSKRIISASLLKAAHCRIALDCLNVGKRVSGDEMLPQLLRRQMAQGQDRRA